MSECFHETFMWIRHDGDAGLWWPGVYQGTDAGDSWVVKGFRESSSRDRRRGESPSSKARRVWVPFYGLHVEATQWRDYCPEMPAGPDKCYEYNEAAKLGMDKLIQKRAAGQDLDATAPLSPPSPSEGAYLTAIGETTSDVASDLLCPSSVGNISQASPALSVSSTVTEREAPITPLEPITGLRVNASALSNLTGGGIDSEREQGGDASKTACGRGTCVTTGVCSPQSGAKRSWAQTSPGQQQQQQQRPRNREGAGFPGTNVERMQEKSSRGACPADRASPARNTIFTASSQFPRLGGPLRPHGPIFCHAQGSKQGLADAGLETGRHDPHGGLFDGVAGFIEGSCGEYLHQDPSKESEAVDNVRAGGPKQAGVEPLPAQQSMGASGMELAADAVGSTDRDASSPPGEAAPTPVVVALPLQSEQRFSEQVPTTTSQLPHGDANEAATFRAVGITGNEDFKRLCPKLLKLKWKWGGQVGPLSSTRWFLKVGAATKTAQAGVGKFEPGDDVVRYVQKVLGAQGAATPDSEGGEVRAGRPKQAGVEPLPAQQSMGACGMELAANAVATTHRDASTPPGEAAPTPMVVALPLQGEQRFSEQVPTSTSQLAHGDANEAATFRAVGIAGNEDFKRLCPKLLKLKWKWGGQVGPLSSTRWFLKAGAATKTAQAGVGKFESGDDVVRYVQKVLGAQGVATPDSKGGEVRAGRPKQAGMEPLPAQQSMDASGMELAADAVATTHRNASTPPGEAAPTPMVVALPLQSEQRFSEQVPTSTSQLAHGDANEAATFRAVGIAGNEDFKRLCPKLLKLKWKWGGQVGPLSSTRWFLKAGAATKTAQAGVGKFESGDDVVRYVQKVLRSQGAATPDSEGSEVASQTGDDSLDESDDDLLGNEGRVEEEQGTPEPTEGEREGLALQTALEALHPSKAPGVMKQRATEFKRVLEFVVSRATDPSGGSLYLCGCPGTGKTQTMAHVQAEVRRVASKGAFPTPAFHAFTGTAFTDPNAMHSSLWRAVTGGVDVPNNIEKALSAKLKRRRKPTASSPMIVVVLDEIDQLLSRSRHVLRKLFEWADAPKSRLVLVGIANSIEFDVGFSSLNTPPEKVLFQAYTPEDLMSILTERVGAVVHKPAVQLCSKKIAATHGDARRAISLCREAVVLAKRELQDKLDNAGSQKEQESKGQQEEVALVTIRHMSMALSAGRVSRYADAIAALSMQAQIVLSVAAAAVYGVSGHRGDQIPGAKAGKRVPLTQGDLHEKCMSVWGRLRTGGGLSQIEFSGTIDMLAAQGLLKLKGKQLSGGRARQLVLLIEFADVEIALGGHPFFKAAVGI